MCTCYVLRAEHKPLRIASLFTSVIRARSINMAVSAHKPLVFIIE